MKKNRNRRRRDRAEAKVKAHPMFPRLFKAFEGEPSVERAELVHQVCAEHNSARAVARAVNFDLGTIRRDLRIAELSIADKNRIRDGVTATQVLAEAVKRVIEESWHKRLEAERATRLESDKLKGLIITWVSKANLAGPYAVRFLDDADGIVHEWHKAGKLLGRLPLRSLPEATIAEEDRKAKLLTKSEDAIDWYYRDLYCLTNWVVRLVPEWSILDRALTQARVHFEQLREPCVFRSPEERMKDILDSIREDDERRRMVRSMGAESMRDRRSLVPVVPSSDTGETPAPKTALELVTQQAEERHRIAHDLSTGRLVLDSILTPVLSPAALKQASPGVVAGGGDDINQGNKVPSM